jgi:hypothetical protein
VEKTRFLYEKKKRKYLNLDTPAAVTEYFSKNRSKINKLLLLDEEEETEETDYVLYEYIDLVYPPGATPPIRESIKRMNFIDISPIQNMICR